MIRSITLRAVGVGSFSLVTTSLFAHSHRKAYSESSQAAESNPLLVKSKLPKFHDIKPSHAKVALESNLANLNSEFDIFEKKVFYSDA